MPHSERQAHISLPTRGHFPGLSRLGGPEEAQGLQRCWGKRGLCHVSCLLLTLHGCISLLFSLDYSGDCHFLISRFCELLCPQAPGILDERHRTGSRRRAPRKWFPTALWTELGVIFKSKQLGCSEPNSDEAFKFRGQV